MNRWLIALACAWVNLFIFSLFRSSGLVYVKVIDLFNCTYQQAAFSVSVIGSVASTTGLASGFLTHYFTPKTLILFGIIISSLSLSVTYFAHTIQFVIVTIGVFQGIGIGFVTCLLPAVLNSYFDQQKSIALGISYAGATLAGFIFPLIIQFLFNQYGFHLSMLFISGIIFLAIIGGCFLNLNPSKPNDEVQLENVDRGLEIPNPDHQKLSKDNFFVTLKNNIKKDYKLLRNYHFLLCVFTYNNFIIDFISFIIILPDIFLEKNIQNANPQWLLSLFAITDFIGRLLPGWLSHWNIITDHCIYLISITLLGLCMLLIVLIQSWINFILVTLLCGFVTGCQMVLSPVILADYLGRENTAVAFGIENFICGIITMFFRPMIIGIKDIYGNYNKLGYILFTTVLINTGLWIIEIIIQKFRSKNTQHN